MSTENAKSFLQTLGTDVTLQERFTNADQSGRMQLAAEMGLEFSSEELATALNGSLVRSDGELSNAELSSVAGGIGFTPPVAPVSIPGSVAGPLASAAGSGLSPTINNTMNNNVNVTINIG